MENKKAVAYGGIVNNSLFEDLNTGDIDYDYESVLGLYDQSVYEYEKIGDTVSAFSMKDLYSRVGV